MPAALVRVPQPVPVPHQPDGPEGAGPFQQLGHRGRDRAALAGGQVLGGEERERGQVGQRPHRPAVVRRPDGVRRVRDEHGVGLVGHLAELVVLGRVPGVVDRGDRPGPGGHRRLRGRRVEVRRVLLDVGEDHSRAEHRGRRRGGHERHRAGDDLAARPDPGRRVRRVQRRGAVADRDTGCPGDPLQVVLEEVDPRAGGQPVAAQGRGDGLDVVVGHLLPPVRQHHFSSIRVRISSTSSHRSLLSER
jgi:hypothetical protein